MYDHLLVILYRLSYTHGCYSTHVYGLCSSNASSLFGGDVDALSRETFVKNVQAACVESAQTFYTPSDCWNFETFCGTLTRL